MTWQQYVEFTATTALPVASDPEYLRLGVLEEAHEALAAYHAWQAAVRGREKRVLRGDAPEVLRAKDIAASRACAQLIEELGDLAWYVARMDALGIARDSDGSGVPMGPCAMEFHKHLRRIHDFNLTHGRVLYLGLTMLTLGAELADVELDDIFNANVAKLTARKSAGTIQGEGTR